MLHWKAFSTLGRQWPVAQPPNECTRPKGLEMRLMFAGIFVWKEQKQSLEPEAHGDAQH